MMKRIIVFVFLVFLFCINCCIAFGAANGDFKLKAPIKIERIQAHWDGGTIGVLLKDYEDSELSLCFDYRMSSKTYGRIFVGAVYPNDNAKLVATHSELENKILSTLTDSIEAHLDGSTPVVWEGAEEEYINNLISMLQGYINKLKDA